VHNYTFTDATPSNGVNYYRLRQVDINGKEALSKVVSVVAGKNFLILKNTLVQNLLDVTVGEESKTPLSIFNVSGQLVYSAKVQGNQLLDLSALTSGLYIVRTEAGEVSRFVKQ
jgi:Secretion system C-terminal sorting domain